MDGVVLFSSFLFYFFISRLQFSRMFAKGELFFNGLPCGIPGRQIKRTWGWISVNGLVLLLGKNGAHRREALFLFSFSGMVSVL